MKYTVPEVHFPYNTDDLMTTPRSEFRIVSGCKSGIALEK